MWFQGKYFIVLVCIISSSKSINVISSIENDTDIIQISDCIVDIVETNNFFKVTLLFYHDQCQNNNSSNFLEKLFNAVAQNNIPIVVMDSYVDNGTNEIYNGTLIIIRYIENCECLMELNDQKIENNAKHIIVLHSYVISNCFEKLRVTARTIDTLDVVFMYKDYSEITFKLFTCIPILDSKTCKRNNSTNFTLVGTCNGALDKRIKNVYPDKKLMNWMGCPLNVGMGALYPYVKTYNETLENMDPIENAEGCDVEIVKIVANYFNATLRLYNIRIVAENILLDLSFMPFLLNGSLDVCAGGLYRIFNDVVSYSGIYARQTVIWVYTVERGNKSWLTFIRKTDGVYIFIIFYLIHCGTWILICRFDKNVTSLTNTLFYSMGALFGATSMQESRTLKQKILNFFFSLLCLHLSAYISIQLFAFLTIQGPPHVYKNTDELSETGRPLYLKDIAKYFIEDEKYIEFANTSYDCADFADCLVKTVRGKGITLIVDGLFADVQINTAVAYEARILKASEDVLVVYHEMLLRKASPIVGNFEKVILRLFEAGICQRLYLEAVGILDIDKARFANQNMMSNSYSCVVGCEITLSQCAGVFYVWITGYILSCLVFIAEVLVHTSKSRKYRVR